MRKLMISVLLLALPLAAIASPMLAAETAVVKPAPVAELVKNIDIPFEEFTLANGLRVIVHTDRKAPIVAVSVWYHIGSKDEPTGKTGFAHLFEHLMFGGSENNPGSYIKTLEDIGATNLNGTTWYDRTNYYQDVPTPALPMALFVESDRMGHLLGAVSQQTLDAQRGVVQNEKRQGDNQPLGLTQYETLKALFPEGHPYRHSTIGSMADLDAASMDDVRAWFQSNYGPNNAVLVLAGDIDVATAKPLVEKFFGDIPAGPAVKRYDAPVPEWKTTRRETLYDRIPTAELERSWVLPGRTDPATVPVDIALTILAGGSSSRLYNDLVREKKLAVSVSGGVQAFEKVSIASIGATVAEGVDPAKVEARIDAILAEFLKNGPTADEVERVVMRNVAGTIRGLEAVGGGGGKATALAEGAVFAGNPAYYKAELQRYADATPASVKAAAQRWLSVGDYRQTVLPGDRPAPETVAPRKPTTVAAAAPVKVKPRMPVPEVGTSPSLTVPPVERATLSNGIQVELARRTTIPVVRVMLSFDAGFGADSRSKPGTQSLVLALLDEGAAGMTGPQIAEARERLGANVGGGAAPDRTRISLDALKPNLTQSLELFADIVQQPDFAPGELERVRGQALTGIAQEETDPGTITRRILPVELYGPDHPYGVAGTGTGTAAGLKAVTRDDLIAWHKRWIRPDNARIFVVGDITMAELKPALEKSFGQWKPDPATSRGTKAFPPVPVPKPRIILVDRPGSPQSYIRGGVVLDVKGSDDPIALRAANDILGGLFSSRLNMDIREEKSWAYGVASGVGDARERVTSQIVAPVQADRTGDSIAAMIADVAALTGSKPITPAERDNSINNSVRSMPGEFESGGALLAAIEKNAVYGRGDDYYAKLVPRLQALTTEELNQAAKILSTARFTWVVVGDRKTVEPQLKQLGLPVEVR